MMKGCALPGRRFAGTAALAPNMSIDISAIICTRRRLGYLELALQSLSEQTLDPARYEVIVVDNCEQATARGLFADRQRTITNLRYLNESTVGLSAARNRGLREARGTLVAFLDDDAIASPNWLETALKAFETYPEEIGFLGGRVLPIYEAPRPDWLCDQLLPFLSVTTLGDEVTRVQGTSGLVGTNMIFKRKALLDVGCFPVELGRKADDLRSNEELHVKWLLERAGLPAVYHPDVVVSHHVPASRLTTRWFRDRLYWQGRSDAISWQIEAAPNWLQRSASIRSASVILMKSALLTMRLAMDSHSQQRACTVRSQMLIQLGFIVGILRGNGSRSTPNKPPSSPTA